MKTEKFIIVEPNGKYLNDSNKEMLHFEDAKHYESEEEAQKVIDECKFINCYVVKLSDLI